MDKEKRYDAIVIGAGVGGLTAATLLAKEGRRVLILEQSDRVGGRALSIKGEEISDNGVEWYKKLLASQYTYLAGSTPDVDTIINKRTLDGYTIDIGYHALSVNGNAYLLDFEELVGGLDGLTKHGCHYGTWYKGQFYMDMIGGNIDPKYKEIIDKENIPFLLFYTEPYRLSDEDIDALEKVSLQQWGERHGLTKNDIIWNNIRSVATLFSTINNPNDISIGDIFRFFKYAIGPKVARGLVEHVGGFVENGVMEWSKAVARKFQSYGGEIILNAQVKEVKVKDDAVTGVVTLTKDGDSQEWMADAVISSIPAQHTFGIIDKAYFPKEWADRTESMYGYGSYVPYMGLNRLVMPEEHARCGIKNDCVFPKEEGFDWDVYICWNIQSIVDPSVAPRGKYLYSAYLPVTEKEAKDRVLINKLIKRLPDFMEEIYPGFKESIDWRLDLVCWKLEGVAKSISQAGTQKVPVKSPYIGGLYFAGDTAKGYGVAMDCACTSGVICAQEFLGKDFGIR
ncbi:MAG: NAD(P)/FAD-dependent oxidoreductase [Thermodesulfobacteriota bacterium]|nr:NAD(P)/FAD-dependent oxidoreductase [Thermodesulfobacteriota bacterium]